MNDRELLDVVASDAPPAHPDYADDVLRMARRTRTRRRAAVLTAVTGLVLAAVGTTAVLQSARPDHRAVQVKPADPTAAIYAVAIKALAETNRVQDGHRKSWPVLYVLDGTCPDVNREPPGFRCAHEPLGDKLRSDLTRALQTYAPVTFVADPNTVLRKDGTVLHDSILITLSPIRWDGAQALVPIADNIGGQNGMGTVYREAGHDGQWTLVGLGGGAGWIT
jgi:hypothetical protein